MTYLWFYLYIFEMKKNFRNSQENRLVTVQWKGIKYGSKRTIRGTDSCGHGTVFIFDSGIRYIWHCKDVNIYKNEDKWNGESEGN